MYVAHRSRTQSGSDSAPSSRLINQLLGILASLSVIAAAVLIYFIVSGIPRTPTRRTPPRVRVPLAPMRGAGLFHLPLTAHTDIHTRGRLGSPTALLQSTAPDGSDLSASVTSVRQAFSRYAVPGVVTSYVCNA